MPGEDQDTSPPQRNGGYEKGIAGPSQLQPHQEHQRKQQTSPATSDGAVSQPPSLSPLSLGPSQQSPSLLAQRAPSIPVLPALQQGSPPSDGPDVLSDRLQQPPAGVKSSSSTASIPVTSETPPVEDSSLAQPRTQRRTVDRDGKRISFSSLYSLSSSLYSGAAADKFPSTAPSSITGSVRNGMDESTGPSPVVVPTMGANGDDALPGQAMTPASGSTGLASQTPNSTSPRNDPVTEGGRSTWISRGRRRFSGSTAASSASEAEPKVPLLGKIGVCALDVKARSKPSQNILTRLQAKGDFEVIVFGDKVILDEDVENWPECDFLIAFFSDGFPLDKAIAYAELRKPYCINDLPMQKILWDRRLCLRILDQMSVSTPKRLEVNRDGGPRLESSKLAQHVHKLTGVKLDGPSDGTGGGAPKPRTVSMSEDGESLIVDGKSFKKPFVEKPVNGEDHNIHIYFPDDQHYGGGGRRLFRKIGNKSSEYDPDLKIPRCITEPDGSYLYEQFLRVDNAEDVKAYTVGPDYCHAETRKSPVVDGLVRRNTHGKELRYITKLTEEESAVARKISNGFGQKICGFDMLRVGQDSFVIDVNGWSFVKDNNDYYDKAAKILRETFTREKHRREGNLEQYDGPLAEPNTLPRKPNGTTNRLKEFLKTPSKTRLSASPLSHLIGQGGGSTETSPPSLVPTPDVNIVHKGDAGASEAKESVNEREPSATAEKAAPAAPPPSSKHSWKLKGMVAVIRHADRTPKQKFKFTFHTQPFIDLLKGHQEEVIIKGAEALQSVCDAVGVALKEGVEDREKLRLLQTSLNQKGAWPGTKVQIKPMFRKRTEEELSAIRGHIEAAMTPSESPVRPQNGVHSDTEKRPPTRSDSMSGPTFSRFSALDNDLVLDKLQLVIKWGGEPTHAARYQAQDVGLNMRDDLKLMNKEALNDVRIFTSSERRVSTSAEIFASTFLDENDLPDDFIQVRKDLLDDSNAAKDVMDKVKKKLKLLLREGNSAPSQFTWPENFPEPSVVLSTVVELMKFHRAVMRHNLKRITNPGTDDEYDVSKIQNRWCAGEDAKLFKERWGKLFKEFCDTEKVDPGKLSELYDSMKFDALHNRQFLEWVFLPPDGFVYEGDVKPAANGKSNGSADGEAEAEAPIEGITQKKKTSHGLMQPIESLEDSYDHYFKLYPGSTPTKPKMDKRLARLRQLYSYAKILFDFVTPQEYGIKDSEKLEIGLLTSLPLLQEIVMDLEEVQASQNAKSFFYFTKESHIYTLLNCILEGGIETKIARRAIPELDYLSQICFELYESRDVEASTFAYSIRISISPGCHTFDPLDVQLDSRHAIGCAPRRSLTSHHDWKKVIETLKAKFDTVELPKTFIAVNLSDKHAASRKKHLEKEKAAVPTSQSP